MRFSLKQYQTEATKKILKRLKTSKSRWHEDQERTAFALTATTGSGKTVIAATVIEALLHGSDEFDIEPDPTAVVLWVSKDPSLNEQTRSRFIECADRIPVGGLVLLDKTYAEESLQTGIVHFINPDKLRDGADFVKHTDTRHVTFWEILAKTIKDPNKTLYMVLDEAHEGMKKPSTRDANKERTIVQRIISGNGVNPAVPIVWGISATPKRFDDAMAQSEDFTKAPNIAIDPKDVQASGLLKNALWLYIPDEDADMTTTMVRDATLDFVDVSQRWAEYGEREGLEKPVLPLLVVQIPNKSSGEKDEKGRQDEAEDIGRILEVVRQHWPDMPEDGIAHVLGDHATIEVGPYEIEKVAPQDVQHDPRIRVLIAKDAVSTGWDCPRAEVLVSLRPGIDRTHITQLLGRMVRTPLAQSTSEDRLNTASCYLPKFDKAVATVIAEEIMGMREPSDASSTPAVSKVFLKPVTLRPNPDVAQDVWTLIESLPSQRKPATAPKPIKRLLMASQALSRDKIVPDADTDAAERLHQVLDEFLSEHEQTVKEETEQILTADVRRIIADRGGSEATADTTQRAADATTVDDALRHLRRLLTNKVVNGYLQRDMQAAINAAFEDGEDPSAVDVTAIRARVAALGLVKVDQGEETLQEAVEEAADSLVRNWLNQHKAKIKKVADARKQIYEAIQEMARKPEDTAIEIPTEQQVDTVDTEFKALPKARKHVLSDADGDYPLDTKLNRWERAAIAHETAKDETVGWYRNPSAASNAALRIPYEATEGAWKSVQPDLVFVSKDEGGTLRPLIIDPHGAHLGDTSPKVKALSLYADTHGDKFERIMFVGVEKDGALYGLDLKKAAVRKAVYECPADTASIVALFEAHGTKYCEI